LADKGGAAQGVYQLKPLPRLLIEEGWGRINLVTILLSAGKKIR